MKTKNEQGPAWISLNQKALNGNILISGSIGGGKTQGTILPYFDQIIRNFEPKPSVLAIDPKGTFVPQAIDIVRNAGLDDKIVHFTLDGEVTFNPIYHPDLLRNARFMDTAFMIRAAATNCLGKSSDAAFWEAQSFNLIRNSLIYCAAVHQYYTLNDLYSVILRAVDDDVSGKLQETMDTGEFDEEQKFNIAKARDYFGLELKNLEEKVRSGIVATSTSFLNQFQEFRASRIFCPPEDKRSLTSIDEVVDAGKIILFDIKSPALARSMGTIIKLLYQQSILDRLKDKGRDRRISGVLIVDEYQDVVTSGHGMSLGDDRFLAKSREANAISIMATQSLASLQNSIGRKEATKELCQNFRTWIASHSSDHETIQMFRELVGQEEKEKVSRSFSEQSPDARANYILGGFEADSTNISESVSTSSQREFTVTGKEFSRLKTFECFALVFDGVSTEFHKLYLKPFFLKNKATRHKDVIAMLGGKVAAIAFCLMALLPETSLAFPNICSVAKTVDFSSCMDLKVSACACGVPPRPCTRFSYYAPTTFVEVVPNPGESFFSKLPGARVQLSSLDVSRIPFGAEADEDTQSFQAHVLPVPFSGATLNLLPCHVAPRELGCFEAMSEHLGGSWASGSGDLLQPSFLARSTNPKACLLAGAARSVAGGEMNPPFPGTGKCSTPLAMLKTYPPSSHSACTGWGAFFPRHGVYHGPSQTAGALMIAARMKSLASEVFLSTPTNADEKWQMIYPQSSSCFREGENLAFLETYKRANELGRLKGGPLKSYLFAVWSRVTCCQDVTSIPTSLAVSSSLKAACQGVGQ